MITVGGFDGMAAIDSFSQPMGKYLLCFINVRETKSDSQKNTVALE